jgi:5-methyltetrahydrofolate--homocysteine methyltransferase
MADLSKLGDSILNGDAAGATAAAKDLMAAGTDPLEVVTRGISPAMAEVGRRFEAGEYFVPELLVAARATKAVFEIIRPAMAKRGTEPAGRVVIGTVKGDLHDIGKNLVAAMLEGGGFEVVDLGVNVAPERIVNAVREKNAQLVGLSALLTTTMPEMKNAIEALKGAGLRDRVKVMIGGAPVTEPFAQEIGADGYGENAASAVGLARKLMGLPPQN